MTCRSLVVAKNTKPNTNGLKDFGRGFSIPENACKSKPITKRAFADHPHLYKCKIFSHFLPYVFVVDFKSI